jgi:phenylalanyl-tRNA synthetase beta chain
MLDQFQEPPTRKSTRPALDVSDLMPVKRDFAFIVDEDLEAQTLVRAARGADRDLISEVSVFDVFTGGALPDGKKSIAVEVTISPRQKTLTDEDIAALSKKVVTAVEKATGGRIRS